jgi:hypothetical protein
MGTEMTSKKILLRLNMRKNLTPILNKHDLYMSNEMEGMIADYILTLIADAREQGYAEGVRSCAILSPCGEEIIAENQLEGKA